MFATSRSRSWRRTNRLFNAISPNRTSRTNSVAPSKSRYFSSVINTAPTFASHGRGPALDPGRPHLWGGVHLLEPGPRRWPLVRADPPVDRRGSQGFGGYPFPPPDKCDGGRPPD